MSDPLQKQSPGGVLQEWRLFKIRKICWKTPVSESLFNKAAGLRPIKNETPTQVIFCGSYEIFKSNFFMGHPQWLLPPVSRTCFHMIFV